MKQTAVQWFANKMMTEYHSKKEWDDIFDQALEMEKEQIIDAYDNTNSMAMNGEQYYNETFKSE